MQTIEIHDLDEDYEGEVLRVDFKYLLSCVSDEEKNYHWTLLDLHGAKGNLRPVTTIPELENRINNSLHGIEYPWEELIDLADKLESAVDIMLVGNAQKKINEAEKNFDEYHRKNDIAFELFDRCFWIVSSKSDSLIQRIKNKFHDV